MRNANDSPGSGAASKAPSNPSRYAAASGDRSGAWSGRASSTTRTPAGSPVETASPPPSGVVSGGATPSGAPPSAALAPPVIGRSATPGRSGPLAQPSGATEELLGAELDDHD